MLAQLIDSTLFYTEVTGFGDAIHKVDCTDSQRFSAVVHEVRRFSLVHPCAGRISLYVEFRGNREYLYASKRVGQRIVQVYVCPVDRLTLPFMFWRLNEALKIKSSIQARAIEPVPF